jgi:hypothetical protein
MRLLEQWGLLKLKTPYDSFYALEALDADGQSVDFKSYRNKVRTLSHATRPLGRTWGVDARAFWWLEYRLPLAGSP